MRWLARLVVRFTPTAVKLRACREVSADFASILAAKLDASGAGGLDAYRAAARETGLRAGRRLRDNLLLGDSFKDAELAWRLVSKVSGMKFAVERQDARSVFNHTFCPVFASGGKPLCDSFCLPMVEGLTEAICPSCRVEIVQAAGPSGPCTKALVYGGKRDA